MENNEAYADLTPKEKALEWINGQQEQWEKLVTWPYMRSIMLPIANTIRSALSTPTPEQETVVDEWIKAQPHAEYDMLKRQFYSLKCMLTSMGKQLSFYQKKDYETGEKHLAELQVSLDSERAMNADLTEEVARWEKSEIGTLRKDILRELDTNGGDYLTVRTAVAKLSGLPAMALTFDGHIDAIREKLKRPVAGVDLRAVRDELDNAAGCFNAAYSEGLLEKLAEETNTDVGSLHDLITRRVVYALGHIESAAVIIDSAGMGEQDA